MPDTRTHLPEIAPADARPPEGPEPQFTRIFDFFVASSRSNWGRQCVQILLEYDDLSVRGRYTYLDELAADLAKSPESVVARHWAQQCKGDSTLARSPSDLAHAGMQDALQRIVEAVAGRIERGEKVLGTAIGDARKQLRDALRRLDELEKTVRRAS